MVSSALEIELLKDKVRSYLPKYLEEQGIEADKDRPGDPWYCCLNPDHDDKNPSMHYVDKSEQSRLLCFSCGAAYDIFHIAHIFENKPLEGKGFYEHNLYYLAEHFGIPFERPKLTDEELYNLRIESTYAAATTVLTKMAKDSPDIAFEHTRARGIADKICLKMGVFTAVWTDFLKKMKNFGQYSQHWLESVGITEDFIGLDLITFIIKDYYGKPVGMARRWVSWNKESQSKAKSSGDKYLPKYLNSDSRKCTIYNKSETLYGIDIAKESGSQRIDIVEGYTDQLALYQAGHPYAVAICGTSLTDDQVNLMKKLGFTNINLVLDSDQAGYLNMEKYLNNLRGVRGIKPTITRLGFQDSVPAEDRDPYNWIKLYNLEQYWKQPLETAFDWQLNKMVHRKMDFNMIANSMVDYIISEPSAIERERLIERLSEKTGVSRDAITEDVKERTTDKIDNVINSHMKKIKYAKTIQDKIELLSEAKTQSEQLVNIASEEELSTAAEVYSVIEITENFMSNQPGLEGWNTGFKCFNENFGGIPKGKELIGFAGNPNTGKSTLLYNICMGLLTNDNPNLCCAFWTLDDPVQTLITKLLAIKTRYKINHCRYPLNNGLIDSSPIYTDAVRWVRQMVRESRLRVQGVNIGNQTEHCERWLKTIQDEEQKELVVFVDNFHSIMGTGIDMRINFKMAAEWMQKMSDSLNITFICSLEPTKQAMTAKKPHMEHIAESSKIQFSFKLLGLVHNQMHEERGRAKMFWTDNGIKRPILEVNYEKNKITEFKGTHWFKFRDDRALLEEISFDEIKQMKMEEHKSSIAEANSIDKYSQ